MNVKSKQVPTPIADAMHDEKGLVVLIVRPGITELEEQGRIAGTLDVPLSERGKAEVEQLALQISDVKIDYICSAPCSSAMATAASIAAGRGVKVKTAEGMTNLDHGLWQGMKIEDLQTNQPKLVRRWEEFPESVCPPAGEPVEDVIPRVEKVLKKIFRKFKSGNVVVVAPEPLASIISAVLQSKKTGDLLKAQAQSSGIEMVAVTREQIETTIAK